MASVCGWTMLSTWSRQWTRLRAAELGSVATALVMRWATKVSSRSWRWALDQARCFDHRDQARVSHSADPLLYSRSSHSAVAARTGAARHVLWTVGRRKGEGFFGFRVC